MQRRVPLKRLRPLAVSPLRKTNPARWRSEFARCYGSRARVAWIKAQPCLVCCLVPSENAHTVTGGMGRKADADTIIPLCHAHHRELHGIGRVAFERRYYLTLALWAKHYARQWENDVAGGTH